MQKQIFALAILTLFTSSAFVLGATDTPETRRHEAERYLQATPAKGAIRGYGGQNDDESSPGSTSAS